MRIAVVGAGYVGLVSAACFAELGNDVACVDVDEARVAGLNRGVIPIHEEGLASLVEDNLKAGRLGFTTVLAAAVAGAEVVFIAVGTPGGTDGRTDLSAVNAAAAAIAKALTGPAIVAIKSTVPVGTADAVEATMRAANPGAQFVLVSNPEFLREGLAVGNFMKPERVVVGTDDAGARETMAALHAPLAPAPIVMVSRRSAEIIKYAANAYLAMRLSFINEVADLCDAAGGNVDDVSYALGLDTRIGSRYFTAGAGFGGSCLPKDTREFIATARAFGAPVTLIETAVAVNDVRRGKMVEKIAEALGGELAGTTIAILGLTFAPNTDDLRESPALTIIAELQRRGARIRAFDPVGMPAAKAALRNVTFGADAYEAAKGADAAVIVTEWAVFRTLDLPRLKSVLRQPVLVDLRNVVKPDAADAAGLQYTGVGRGGRSRARAGHR
jgi:UDPglucose 6-dehydrogenase